MPPARPATAARRHGGPACWGRCRTARLSPGQALLGAGHTPPGPLPPGRRQATPALVSAPVQRTDQRRSSRCSRAPTWPDRRARYGRSAQEERPHQAGEVHLSAQSSQRRRLQRSGLAGPSSRNLVQQHEEVTVHEAHGSQHGGTPGVASACTVSPKRVTAMYTSPARPTAPSARSAARTAAPLFRYDQVQPGMRPSR